MSGETKRAQKIEVGIGLPNFGDALESIDAREAAMAIEHAGFDGIWLTDHLLIPAEYESKYPYSKDGSFFLPEGGWWFESIVTLSYIAAVTSRVRLGIGVCVLPLREPRALSQQLATLDRLSGGRVVLGAGAAWLAEELDALEVPRKARGLRVEGAIELMRQCWTGEPQPGTYGPFGLPNRVMARPTPARSIPILLAGGGPKSLRRIVTHGDGWYGAAGAGTTMAPEGVAEVASALTDMCAESERDPSELTLGLRIAVPSRQLGSDDLTDYISALIAAGVTLLTIDFGWPSLAEGKERLERLRESVGGLR